MPGLKGFATGSMQVKGSHDLCVTSSCILKSYPRVNVIFDLNALVPSRIQDAIAHYLIAYSYSATVTVNT